MTPQELTKILDNHKLWLAAPTTGQRADLRSADLSGANLSNADLSNADLYNTNLRGANLRSADLRGAYLGGANLSGANLSGANLSGSDLSGANLSGAKYGDELLLKYFAITNIGSRNDCLQVFITASRTTLKTGCFTGSPDDLAARTDRPDYKAALIFISTMEKELRK